MVLSTIICSSMLLLIAGTIFAMFFWDTDENCFPLTLAEPVCCGLGAAIASGEVDVFSYRTRQTRDRALLGKLAH